MPVAILDGGMGRQLLRMGAPFRLPEWSALALIEAPRFVGEAHDAFIAAGAEIITTNTYGVTPTRIGEACFAADGRRLADLAGRLARTAADRAAEPVLVAGSLPPVFESYRPESFDADRAAPVLEVLVSGLAPYVDLWLIETQSSTIERGAAMAAARRQAPGTPIWVSYTLRDGLGCRGPPRLRSGEACEHAVALELGRGVQAILFNCSQPEVMNAAVQAATRRWAATGNGGARIGVYANAFAPELDTAKPYAGISALRDDVSPERYVRWASEWVDSGATIIGGCCGIGPEHIKALRARFHQAAIPGVENVIYEFDESE